MIGFSMTYARSRCLSVALFLWLIMITSIEVFKEILAKYNVVVPEHLVEVFRDLIDAQANTIFIAWLIFLDKCNKK